MRTLCLSCKFGNDLSDKAIDYCYRHEQTHQDYFKLRVVTSCTGYREKPAEPITIDEKQQPAKVAV